MTTKTSAFIVAEHLRTKKECSEYLRACIEESQGDPVFVLKAKAEIARAERLWAKAAKLNGPREE